MTVLDLAVHGISTKVTCNKDKHCEVQYADGDHRNAHLLEDGHNAVVYALFVD